MLTDSLRVYVEVPGSTSLLMLTIDRVIELKGVIKWNALYAGMRV